MNKLVALMASAAIGFRVSQAASAEDLPVKALLAPAAVWSWTGLYVGAHVGAGWGTTETTLNSVAFPGAPAVPFNLPISQNSSTASWAVHRSGLTTRWAGSSSALKPISPDWTSRERRPV